MEIWVLRDPWDICYFSNIAKRKLESLETGRHHKYFQKSYFVDQKFARYAAFICLHAELS